MIVIQENVKYFNCKVHKDWWYVRCLNCGKEISFGLVRNDFCNKKICEGCNICSGSRFCNENCVIFWRLNGNR